MLSITIPNTELFDESTEEFLYVKETTLKLEHSLVSLSKWESKWNKPFLNKTLKTTEETIDYIRCMTLTQNVNPLVYNCLSEDNLIAIKNYIDAPMTATVINEDNKETSRDIITSEVIYSWMISLNIPFECQKWHLQRLIMLINVCSIHNRADERKMSDQELAQRNRELNEKRKLELNTKG